LIDEKHIPTIRDLYPSLSADELAEAEFNLDAYLKLVLEILERHNIPQDGAPPDSASTVSCTEPDQGNFSKSTK
jgi:hypothetical protein